jgi:hypothetical protein
MSNVIVFLGGVAVGALLVAQLRENESSCCQRVASGVREELVDAAGPLGGIAGSAYDALHVGSIAPALLDALGVPRNA